MKILKTSTQYQAVVKYGERDVYYIQKNLEVQQREESYAWRML